MTLATFEDGALNIKSPTFSFNGLSGTLVVGRPWTPFYTARVPGAAVAPTPGVAGTDNTFTSYAGQMNFPATQSGQTIHLAKLLGMSSATAGVILLCDRIWHNSGLSATITTSQTVNSNAWPARDDNESADGEGVLVGMEVSTATGTGTPASLSLGYTNQAGTASRAGANIPAMAASLPIGTFYPFSLQAGDTGVRSIQTFQINTTAWASGTIHLVAYRVIEALEISSVGIPESRNIINGGLKRCWNGTIPFSIFVPGGTTTTQLLTHALFAQK